MALKRTFQSSYLDPEIYSYTTTVSAGHEFLQNPDIIVSRNGTMP